jgi:two-component system OmpR family response regulator
MLRDQPSGASILIVDDDVAATDLQERLISFGQCVRLVASAEDALATFEATHLDLILLSLALPGTDGLVLCYRFNACTTAPIVVLSGHPREVESTVGGGVRRERLPDQACRLRRSAGTY